MASALDDVVQQMAESGIAGLSAADLKADGQYHRFRPEGERRKKKSGWYILFSFTTRNGKEVYAGVYGRGPDKFTLRPQQNGWTVEEREDFKRRQAERERAFKKERKDRADKAAVKARGLWERFKDRIGAAPYLQRKKVKPYSLRFAPNGAVMIPVRNAAGELRAIQWISADGEKRFSSDAEIDGNFHLLGTPTDEGWLAIGEGYATMASVHMATGLPAVAAFHAGNIEKVAAVLRPLYPKAKFLFVGDDDRHLLPRLDARLATFGITERPPDDGQAHTIATANGAVTVCWRWVNDPAMVLQIEATIDAAGKSQTIVIQNAGRAKASAAARKFGGKTVFPHFADPESDGTDFNDLHVTEGLDALRAQIDAATASGPPASAKTRRAEATTGGGLSLKEMLDHFVYLRGQKEIWDGLNRMVIRCDAAQTDFGELFKIWLAHPQRRTILHKNLIFDPGGLHDKEMDKYINLYDGFEMKPDSTKSCGLLVEHLQNICGNDQHLSKHVARWLALPLQKPGAKMRTGLIIHGRRQGTGKSLFFDVMRQIYGRYGRVITQWELESKWGDWISQTLLCIAEEVSAPEERRHNKGILKNLITNQVIRFDEKFRAARQEDNHANFVFLSNEALPLVLDEFDRRHIVIAYETEHPREYFTALGEEIRAGGIQGLFAWLLAYPLGDFNEFTRPPETEARSELIRLSMSPADRFYQEWRDAVLPVPHATCRSSDLYEAYQRWCSINGERAQSHTQFGITIGGKEKKAKLRTYVLSADGKRTDSWQGWVILVPKERQGDVVEIDDAPDVVSTDVQHFQKALSNWKKTHADDV